MRVGILCLMQESNTFLNKKTEFYHFEEDLLLEGSEIRQNMVDAAEADYYEVFASIDDSAGGSPRVYGFFAGFKLIS